MRFSFSPRTTRATNGRGSGSSNGSADETVVAPTVVPCTYHGWVMLPSPPADENAQPTSDNSRRLPYSYDKIVEMAKRVGVAQTQKSRGKKADRATAVITEGSVRVIARKAEEGAMPLLHAAINTVICTLISKRTGVAVVVAHTWDGRGNRGIGCDVIRMKSKGCGAFKSAIQASIDGLNRRNVEARQASTAPVEVPPPYSEASRITANTTPAPSYTPSSRLQRRRSTTADNETNDGYMGVEAFLNYEEPEYLDLDSGDSDDFNADDLSPAGGGYMEVSCDYTDAYLDVAPHATCAADEPPAYEPHPFAPRV
jgi:hypothetical protein